MTKEEFVKKGMKLEVMNVIKDYYKTSDNSEALKIYNEIDNGFQKVLKMDKLIVNVHGDTAMGRLYECVYESCKDYWICEYVMGNISIIIRLEFENFENFDVFERWANKNKNKIKIDF